MCFKQLESKITQKVTYSCKSRKGFIHIFKFLDSLILLYLIIVIYIYMPNLLKTCIFFMSDVQCVLLYYLVFISQVYLFITCFGTIKDYLISFNFI